MGSFITIVHGANMNLGVLQWKTVGNRSTQQVFVTSRGPNVSSAIVLIK